MVLKIEIQNSLFDFLLFSRHFIELQRAELNDEMLGFFELLSFNSNI